MAGAVIAGTLGADAGDCRVVFDDGVKRWIEVADEVFPTIAVGVDGGDGVGTGDPPADLKAVGQTVAIGVGAGGQ